MIIPCGAYKHYKGGIYEVIGMATHTETLEDMVIYKNKDNVLWVHPASMWNEVVDTPNGKIKRFTELKEDSIYNEEMHELELQYPLEIVGQKEKWNILRKNGDGTSRGECPKCKNTYNFSIHTFRNFNHCPNCGCPMDGAE